MCIHDMLPTAGEGAFFCCTIYFSLSGEGGHSITASTPTLLSCRYSLTSNTLPCAGCRFVPWPWHGKTGRRTQRVGVCPSSLGSFSPA